MLKKLPLLLLAATLSIAPVFAESTTPGLGWSQNGVNVSSDQPFIMNSNVPGASNERALDVGTGLTKTDNGANSSFVIGLGAPLAYLHSWNASTVQGFLNSSHNLSGLAAGDILYYDGTNWSLVHKGANSTVFGVDGAGTVGYYAPPGSGTVTNFVASTGSWPSWLVPSVATATSTPTLSVAAGTGLTAYYVVNTDGSGNVTLGALSASHIPNLDAAKITSGALAKAQQHANTVYNDASNTYSGTATQDMSASGQTLLIPIKASGGTTGEINLNSTDLEFRSAGVTHKAAKQATTITAGTGLSGGGDLSTGRTLNISTVPLANGGTNADLSGATTGAVIYKGASALTSLAPVANKLVGFNSGANALTTYNQATGFGGDGSAGAVTKGAVTETTQLQLNSTTFEQTSGNTWAPLSGTIVNATSTCAFNGTTNVGYGCAGGRALTVGGQAHHGAGPGGALMPNLSYSGGGGGGNAGAGGKGGTNAGTVVSIGGEAYPISRIGGSGGAPGCYYSGTGGYGGKGGGSFIACSVGAMSVGASGTISAPGEAGEGKASQASGGGGGGGTVSLNSQDSIANSGTIATVGGAGGNTTSGIGGGGGGGGYIQFMSPSNTNGTRTVTGGAAGTGSPVTAATAGTDGLAVSITATPNLPLLLAMQSDNFARMKSIALAHRVLNFPARDGFDVELTQREAAQACSRGSVIQFAKLVDGNMAESTCIEIGDHVKGNDNAA